MLQSLYAALFFKPVPFELQSPETDPSIDVLFFMINYLLDSQCSFSCQTAVACFFISQ